MEYRCKTVDINKLQINGRGAIAPLCDGCKTSDCTNPIEKRTISIMGINKEHRVCVRYNLSSFVVACEGYTK